MFTAALGGVTLIAEQQPAASALPGIASRPTLLCVRFIPLRGAPIMSDQILLAEAGGVATLILNRPEKLNAFTVEMREQFGAAIETVAALSGVRVLVITGAGRAFSA